MITEIRRHQTYKALHRILSGYPQAFGDKPLAQASLESLGNYNDQLSAMLTELLRPISAVYRPQRDLRDNMLVTLGDMTSLGILVASKAGDQPMKALMKDYKKVIRSVSNYRLHEIALHVVQELGRYPEHTAGLATGPDEMEAFNLQIAGFADMVLNTGLALNTRRTMRGQVRQLLKDCHSLLADELDKYVAVQRSAYPEMYASYRNMRMRKRRYKGNVGEVPGQADISGMVTDSYTGLPVANASITLLQQESVTNTDTDGYYLIDELYEGTYSVGCYAPGYQVPAQVETNLGPNDSQVIDFSLTPENGSPG